MCGGGTVCLPCVGNQTNAWGLLTAVDLFYNLRNFIFFISLRLMPFNCKLRVLYNRQLSGKLLLEQEKRKKTNNFLMPFILKHFTKLVFLSPKKIADNCCSFQSTQAKSNPQRAAMRVCVCVCVLFKENFNWQFPFSPN